MKRKLMSKEKKELIRFRIGGHSVIGRAMESHQNRYLTTSMFDRPVLGISPRTPDLKEAWEESGYRITTKSPTPIAPPHKLSVSPKSTKHHHHCRRSARETSSSSAPPLGTTLLEF